ncbi:ABC transporter ATP-binding protein [Streptomyces sp. DT2A-34]|uniref:ABC transporter ATP-binding protein n=1 Tax=Streptomyces sp. DT2A-34 TaxID=3051182 RepID=UPI00265C4DAD|nr:ABC transporter ATP-binding protein [Streptomyces sp. DT2A-34]MDO0911052.1 ABC transporter ATP-binding protein [Streptomyces sp. DT2A-34]
MTKRLAIRWEMLRRCGRLMPGYTAASLAALTISTFVVAATALSVWAAVNASTEGDVTRAVTAAALAAVAYALSISCQDATDALVRTTSDRFGRLVLHPEIHRDISAMEGMEHLERSDYLDRVTLVRGGTTPLAASLWTFLTACSNMLKVLIMVVLLGAVTPWLGLLALLATVPVWCDARGQRVVQATDLETAEMYRHQQHLYGILTNARYVKEIRTAGVADELLQRQRSTWDSLMSRRSRAQFRASVWSTAGWACYASGFLAGLIWTVSQAVNGSVNLGDITLTVVVATTLRQSIATTVDSFATVSSASRMIEPYLWLRETRQAATRRPADRLPPERLVDGIELRNVSFAYAGAQSPSLRNISLSLRAGSTVALVGEYGSGKTTLVKLLCKFYEPTSGAILVDGEDLDEVDTVAWRARMSGAFQDFGRFHVPVRVGIGLGDLSSMDDDAAIDRALGGAQAGDMLSKLPAGLDTVVGSEVGGIELSEGQWQRIALARASMRQNPLLAVFDEPTASIDAPSEHAIFEQFSTASRAIATRSGAITLLVSHRFSTVTSADVIVVMDHGQVVEVGSHADLMDKGGRYAELYGIQEKGYATS